MVLVPAQVQMGAHGAKVGGKDGELMGSGLRRVDPPQTPDKKGLVTGDGRHALPALIHPALHPRDHTLCLVDAVAILVGTGIVDHEDRQEFENLNAVSVNGRVTVGGAGGCIRTRDSSSGGRPPACLGAPNLWMSKPSSWPSSRK